MTARAAVSDLEAALRRAVEGEVAFDAYSRHLFSTDASMYAVEPLGVVYPRHAGDVRAHNPLVLLRQAVKRP